MTHQPVEVETAQSICDCCTLATAMRDCPACQFNAGLVVKMLRQAFGQEPTVAQLTDSAYMEADLTEWKIGDEVVFGSKEWFEGIEEVSF